MLILSIETSCDETAAAVVEYKRGKFKVCSNIVTSQIKIHQKTGGVVPEVAAREHLKNILPVINTALFDAQVKYTELDRLAVVTGPGLITSLMVGVETAKTLAYLWKKKIYTVNHLEAHLGANFLLNKKITYPALALIVSGGHTELVLINKKNNYKLLGATRDDAAGECFDKCAKILGLNYPGGPEISKRASKGKANIDFPRPMIDSDNYEFSFSGLKTAVLYYVQKTAGPRARRFSVADTCASIEKAIVDVLIKKTVKAVEEYKVKTVMLAGGVAANKKLRQEFQKSFKSRLDSRQARQAKNILIPDLNYCTDQAAMVGAAAAFKNKSSNIFKITVDPNWEL